MTSTEPARQVPIVRTIPGPAAYMCGLTWDGGLLWHSDQDAERIFAVDPADGRVARELRCPPVRADLTYDGSQLVQVGGRPKRLVLVDPDTGEIVGEKPVHPPSGRLTGIELGPEGLWMCLRGPTTVQLRDYATMSVQREFRGYGQSPAGLTYANGVVVHGDFDNATLHALDARTGEHLGTARVPGRPTGLTWDGAHLWYCDFPARSFRAVELDALLNGRPG